MMKQINKNKSVKKHDQSIKIVKQGKCKIRSISLPNRKLVPLHNSHMQIKIQSNIYTQELAKPQFWGCLVSQHFKKIQKRTLNRIARSKTQHKISKTSFNYRPKQTQKSIILLEQYLKRKKSRDQNQQKLDSQTATKLQTISKTSKTPKMVSPLITQLRQSMQLIERYSDIEEKQRQIKRSEQAKNKIQQLNQLIKWRTKVIQKIQHDLDSINAAKLYKF